ncbi:MAG: DUF2510 domain-containing protein [Microbacteriaceae bacterium]
MTPTTIPAPAGWYRDPLGLPQLRWWNGMTWTNSIQESRPEFQAGTPDYAAASPALSAYVA